MQQFALKPCTAHLENNIQTGKVVSLYVLIWSTPTFNLLT